MNKFLKSKSDQNFTALQREIHKGRFIFSIGKKVLFDVELTATYLSLEMPTSALIVHSIP
jgi:hypothetical protein